MVAWLSVIVFVLLGIVLLKWQPLFFILMFYLYFGQLSATFSGALIEKGIWVSELVQWSYPTGGTMRLVFYNMIFFMGAVVSFLVLSRYIPKSAKPYTKKESICVTTLVWGASAVVLAVCIWGLVTNGSALLQGIDRFTFWYLNPNPGLQKAVSNLPFVCMLLGFLYSKNDDKKVRAGCLTILVVAILVNVLYGEKFSGIFLQILFFALPLLIGKYQDKTQTVSLTKIVAVCSVGASLFLPLILYHYSTIHSSTNAWQSLVNRLSLQGEVWWAIDSMMQSGAIVPGNNLDAEIRASFSPSVDTTQVGLRHLMTVISPWWLVERYFEKSVTFSMGYPAIGLYNFGYNGLVVVQIVAGLISSLTAVYFAIKVIRSQFIRSVLSFKIMLYPMFAFAMGNLYEIFSLKMLFYLGLALTVELLDSYQVAGRRAKIIVSHPLPKVQ